MSLIICLHLASRILGIQLITEMADGVRKLELMNSFVQKLVFSVTL